MNLNKEIQNSLLLTGFGACIILGIVLAYFLAPQFIKTTEVDDTLVIEKLQTGAGSVNPPPKNLKRSPIDNTASDQCAQVITTAKNPINNEIKDFPTPCDVPEGWEALN